ncbi:MAG: D-glycerate dehydrogenase [Rhodospirillales bacterium]|nr:D-glycerate dehydrogenase [Rhodospirillales bacterium]
MPLPRLLLSRHYPEAVIARARRDYQVVLPEHDASANGDALIEQLQGVDGALISASNRFTATIFARLPAEVKIIASYSVGYEHVDLDAAKAKGVVITNSPDVLNDATADTALLLLLAASRRARECLQMVLNGDWVGWSPTHLLGKQPTGKRLGIIGMGRIGRAMAERCRALGMDIHYHNRSRLAADLEGDATYHATADELFRVADFLSIHCEMTPATTKLVNARTIALMPDAPVIVNTARGGIVDDEALLAALKSGRVAAAGLDVFDGEPKLHPGYLKAPTAFLLPHIGSATLDTRNAMGFRALDNLDAYFAGREPGDRLA